MKNAKVQNTHKSFSLKELGRRALTVLLTISMVSMNSPLAYAVEESGSSQDASSVVQDSVDTSEVEATSNVDSLPEEQVAQDDQGTEAPGGDEESAGSEDGEGEPETDTSVTEAEVVDAGDADDVEEVTIQLSFDHAYIHYKNQTVAAPTSSLTVPANEDFQFAATADDGCELSEVRANVSGNDMVLEPNADGLYCVEAAFITDELLISVVGKSDPFEASTETVSIDEKRNEQSEFVYEDGSVKVTATLSDPSALPANVKFQVSAVTQGSPQYNYEAYMEALNNNADDSKEYTSDNTLLYDVAFLTNKLDEEGKPIQNEWTEVQLADGVVSLDFQFKGNQLNESAEGGADQDVEVTHLPLKDSVRSSVDTTAEATEISADDIIVETPVDQNASAADNTVQVSLDNLSVVGVSLTTQGSEDTQSTEEPISEPTPPTDDDAQQEAQAITESTNLRDFLTSAEFDAPKNDDGKYVVSPGASYTFRLSFAERYNNPDTLQFPNDGSSMTYTLPEGLEVADGHEGEFTIKISEGSNTYSVTGNTFSINNGVLTVHFNNNHEHFQKFKAAANTRFTLEFEGRLAENTEKILFSDGIEKDLEVDNSSSVSSSKSAEVDKDNNRIKYTVAIRSTGRSSDVVVKDTIRGDALTLDTSSIKAVSSTGNSVSLVGSAQGNSLEYRIAQMSRGEVITLTYYANIDPTKIPEVDGKYVTTGENEVEVYSTEDPDPDKTKVNNTIDYTPSISKSTGVIGVGDGNIKTMTWTLEANKEAKVSMAGSTITDTIDESSQSIMKYSGDGINVVVKDASGNEVRTDRVAWGELTSKTDSTWTYTVPSSDEGKAYSYTITYTTEVDLTGKASVTTVKNNVTTSGGGSSTGTGQGVGTGEVNVYKNASKVDVANKEITWLVSFNVPKEGLDTAQVIDRYPYMWIRKSIYEKVKEGSIKITGLVDGESYDVAYAQDATTITFFKNSSKSEQGLKAGNARTVLVELKTELNDQWLADSVETKWRRQHTNNVELIVNGETKTTQSTAVATLPSVQKESEIAGTRTVDGVELPIYKFTLNLTNVTSDTNEIVDTYDTELLSYYSEPTDAGRIYGGGLWWQGNVGGKVNHIETADGMILTTNSDSLPHDAENSNGYYEAYRIVYYLTVRDKAALEKIKSRAAATEDGKYTLKNTARYGDSTDGAEVTYEYDGLKKEILTSDEDLKKTDEDIWADFRITLNSGGMQLNGGAPLTMTDTVENLSVDINSIVATPAEGVSWDMSGNTVTYTIPDSTPIVITYRARVIMSSLGEVGDTQQIHFSNEAKMKGYDETINKTAERTNKGEGAASIPSINLLKYEAGDMNKTLGGAKFRLLNRSGTPITNKQGEPVEFVSGSDGKISIVSDMANNGWALVEGQEYLLREIEAPKGHMLAGFDYRFTISADGTTDYSNYIYHSGDTMTVKNYSGTDVRVKKVWSDGNERHDSASVEVKLQQKVNNGKWSDTIRRKSDSGWEDAQGVTITLDKSNGWEGVFNKLPLTVPSDINSPVSDDVEADYRVVETKVNNQAPAEGTVEITGGKGEDSGTYVYTITNSVASGNLAIQKSVSSSMPADLQKEFRFTVTLSDTGINGTYGDMVFKDGVATVTLKHGEVKTAEGLPKDVAYTVVENEDDAAGFTVSKAGDTGTISEETSTASFTNTRDSGNLKVSKTVVSDVAADRNQKFTFTVTLSDTSINGTYKDMTFTSGVATFDLADGEAKEATGLPAGTAYTVVESGNSGFVADSQDIEGSIEKAKTKTAAFTNTRKTGNLEVTKTIASSNNADKSQKFGFTVTLSDTSINGQYGEDGMTFTNGVATFELSDGQKATASGLPIGITYTVRETLDSDYTTTPANGEVSGTVAEGTATQEFVNTRVEKGDLAVSKSVVSALDADKTQKFEFKVTLSDTSITGQYGQDGMSFQNGVATFELKDGETKIATGLPKGITYTVEETPNDNFVTTADGAEGTINDRATSTATFTNTRKTGELEIAKTVVSDAAADKAQEFSFTIQLDPAISGTFSDVTFDEDGKAVVTLRGGESKLISGLPITVGYTVTEAKVDGIGANQDGAAGTISATKSTAAFTNTRQTGDLEVSKKVVSDAAADHDLEFTFTVTLSDKTITKTYGDMAFVEGVATVKIKDNQKAIATGLPTGIAYTVTEAKSEGFQTTDKTGDAGTISATKSTAAFTNTRETGDLTVSKQLVSDKAADKDQEFTFTVTLSDTAIGGDEGKAYGDMTFKGGVATVKLKGGESATATGLPTGITYTVVETKAEGFQVSAKTGDAGTISTTASEAAFTNMRDKGGLTVSKTLVSERAADKDQKFTFTVTLGDEGINGTYGDMTFENGIATFELKGGESATATGLPTGVTYTVTETTVDGFDLTAKTGDTGTISTTSSEAAFTNTRKTGSLKVSKTLVSDAAADANKAFTFTVTLDGASLTGTYGDMVFANGVATVTLKGGESATATGLPSGVTYKVTEATAEGFQLTSKTGDAGTISTTESTAAFTNTRDTGDLTVSKQLVSDKAADKDQEFTFTVTLSDTAIGGDEGKAYGDMTFKGGVATVKLKGGESATAAGLPTGITYTVAETKAEGFQVSAKTGEAGTITTTKSTAAFTNTREKGDLKVSKRVVSDAAADADQEFTFTVTLDDTTINGTYGDMTFAAGVATVTLKGGQSAAATGLPTGVGYTVAETEAPGFITEKDGDAGTISKAESTAAFTNTRETGNLTVSKELVSDKAADANQEFTFIVTLDDTTINATYGDMTFAAGVATVALKGGQNAAATGLPTGIGYTVTEASVDGFQLTGRVGDTGTICKDGSSAVLTNTREKGGLTVSKTVVSDAAADHDQEFTFTVELSDTSITKKYGDMDFHDGVANFALKGGQSATATDLPIGMTYTVTEADADGFMLTGKTGDRGTIAKGETKFAAFTNTRETGDLEISKTLVSDAAADADQEFIFTVELSDKTITKTYGDMTFANGIATVALKGGEKAVATGLPTGVTYKVTEVEATGFTKQKTGDEGTISTTKSTASFTNTRETGDLEVAKTLVSDAAADADQEFEFTVELSDKTISKTFGDMVFANGVATIRLKGGEKAVATGLPSGVTYKVTETKADGFVTEKANDAGTISTTKSVAAFTNTRETGELELSKTVVSSTASDKQKEFSFSIDLHDEGINKTYGDMKFERGLAHITLKDGETKKATGLPTGLTYNVIENTTTGFVTTMWGQTGTITTTKAEAKFTNTRDEGGLQVCKRVTSPSATDHSTYFHFTVTLEDTTVSGTYGDMTFASGVAELDLKDGESKTAQGLPDGLKYTVVETDADGFSTTYENETGTIAKSIMRIVEVANTRETGGLEVSKKLVSDAAADKDKRFTFAVALSDNTISGTFGDMVFSGGEATVVLKGGEKATATGLPTGITYTIVETSEDGLVVNNQTQTGTIASVEGKAAYTNTREKGNLKVSKQVVSDAAADKDQEFTFTVELSDKTISGKYADMTFASGVATVKLKGGQSATAAGLPTGVTYEVTEAVDSSFTTEHQNARGTISTTGSTASFTNTRKTGDLEVSKKLVSDKSTDKDQEFRFTVTLSDKTIGGTYGDMNFTAGVATVKLKGGESATAKDLPTGITYGVEETTNEDFVTTSQDAQGQISTTAAKAEFTNTRKQGGLMVSKELVSKATADKSQEFEFTVTLDDKGISGEYGQMTFDKGVATFTLKGGENKLATGLPTGVGYKVSEKANDGFVTKLEGETGTVANTDEPALALITNTRKTGDLTVSKKLVSNRAADANRQFEFNIELSDTTISGTYGDVTFDAGKAKVGLVGGQSVTAEKLPTGIAYTVTEASAEGFELTGKTGETGTISTKASAATFTNTRDTGELTVSKKVVSDSESDKDLEFAFTVELSDKTINGEYGDMTFKDGVASVVLKDNESKTAKGLPTEVDYEVTEKAESAQGFDVQSQASNGTITKDGATATFTNTRLVGSLKIQKSVTVDSGAGDPSLADGVYSFKVTGPGAYANGITKQITITNGASSTIQLDGLFVGDYTIAEVTDGLPSNMSLMATNPQKVTVEAGTQSEIPTVSFVNDLSTAKASVEVTKKFNNWEALQKDAQVDGFTFILTPVNGAPMPGQGLLQGKAAKTVTAETRKAVFGDIVYKSEGVYSYKLSEVVPEGAVDGVYKGIAYDTQQHDVTIAVKTNSEGKLEAEVSYDEGKKDLTIANTYEATGETTLGGTKELAGRKFREGDEWKFNVAQPDGQDAPMPERTEVTVKAAENATIDFGAIKGFGFKDVGKKYTYTITESNVDDGVPDVVNDTQKTVTVSVSDNGDGTLAVTPSTQDKPLVFVNTYQVKKDLVAKKGIEGREWKTNENGDVAEEYTFNLVDDNEWSAQKRVESGVVTSAVTHGKNHEAHFGTFTFTAADVDRTFSYTVREVVPADAQDNTKNGVEYSQYLYTVTYEVLLDDNGELKVEARYMRGEDELDNLNILNTYKADETKAKIEASKVLKGRAATDDEFAFGLYFVNSNGVETLEQTKTTSREKGTAYDEATNTDTLTVAFDEVDCKKAGTENYVIREIVPEGAVQTEEGLWVKDGVTYDSTARKVKVKTTDDLDGKLHAEVVYEDLDEGQTLPTFTNTYFGAKANASFNKEYYGTNLNEGAFKFTMVATNKDFVPREGGTTTYTEDFVDDGQALIVTMTNKAFEGNIAKVVSPTITYHNPGTYYYLITEDAGSNKNVSYDQTQIRVTVEVNKQAEAKVSYTLVANGEEEATTKPTLYNNGLVSMGFDSVALRKLSDSARTASFEPAVRKVLKNGVLNGNDFTFELYEGDEAVGTALQEATNDQNGKVAFNRITYGEDCVGKTYTYTIVEKDPQMESIVYDNTPIKLTVAISEDGEGAIQVEATYQDENDDGTYVNTDDPTFVNEYDTIVIHAVKRSREEPYDPLPGAHYGLWMVNPGGEDVYMGLGRNQQEAEGSELVSSENGDLYYDIPLLEGVAYYFLEEWPPPEGHLVDPYPTDYFTLVHDKDTGKFRLVYEADDDFAKYCPGVTRGN